MATATETILARHDAFMTNNYARVPVAMVRGEGAYLWDAEGLQILDLFAGFGAPILGHCHPELVATVHAQAQKLWHVGNLLHTEPQTKLAEAISKHAAAGSKCFFSQTGADANEAAIKLARLYGNKHPGKSPHGHRYGIVTATASFHGRSFATMGATGQPKIREGFEPIVPGFSYAPFNDIEALKATIDDNTVAVMLEPIQGEGGVNVPQNGYLEAVRALCDERDLLLICDEVWTGVARTGRAFAHQLFNVTPDIFTLAKGAGGGLALGVMVCLGKHADLFDWRTHGRAVHGTTLGGNCLTAAVGAKIWEIVDRDGLIERSARLGDKLKADMRAMQARLGAAGCGVITDVRGCGLFVGVELDNSKLKPELKDAPGVFKECLKRGLLINATQGTTLRIAPCLTVTEAQMDAGLAILEGVLAGR